MKGGAYQRVSLDNRMRTGGRDGVMEVHKTGSSGGGGKQ